MDRTKISAVTLVSNSVMTSTAATASSVRCKSSTRASSAWSRRSSDWMLSALSASMVRVKVSK